MTILMGFPRLRGVKSISFLWLACTSFDIGSSGLNLYITGEANLIPILGGWLILSVTQHA